MLPIQIKAGKAGRLIVLLPFSLERLAKIKTIAGRAWDASNKYWTVPREEGMAHLSTSNCWNHCDGDPTTAKGA